MDQYILVDLDSQLSGNGQVQCLIVDTQASPAKVVAVCESTTTAAPIRDALNGV